ncbi:non-ribosomal peptide synthetase [Acidicapsa ligni]|uniref:non-ribosomal peptide synthetase n=1 Tax=Acidicapsa ligni TaxID=542300 RepID=UPI0021E0E1C0|nr:amino acid adenylation domain-containing protein [Acidicapsa ligni]
MKTIVEFLTDLRAKEIVLTLDGQKLKCSAPTGVLTTELREELAERKQELISFLRSSREAARAGGSGIGLFDRNNPLPLSLAQQRLWFLTQLDPTSPAYNIPTAMRLLGPLHLDAVEIALASIVARHETLRSSFIQVDGVPQVIIQDQVDWKISTLDLTQLTGEAQECELQSWIGQAARVPFDLAQGPLLRATLIKLGSDSHALLLVMHHIISDGWSLGIAIREFAEFYRHAVEGTESTIAPLAIQYTDFADWQRKWLDGGELDRQLPYWKKQLAGAPPVVQFPADHRRPQVESSDGHRLLMVIPVETVTALEQLARQEGSTLFMLMLAAFNVLLYRYSGQNDIVVGTPSASRNRSEMHGLFGFFVNNLVLRTSLEGNPTFRELIARVRDVTLGAYEHQDVPFERLVQALRPERTTEHSPLFQTIFSLQNFPLEDLQLSGLAITAIEFDAGTARFDLTVEVYPRHGTLRAYFEYNTHLYDRETIEQLQGHFLTLLDSIHSDPNQPIDTIPLLKTDERLQILKEWNATAAPHESNVCFYGKFEAQVAAAPDRIAVIAGANSLTYNELNQRANQIAHTLQSLGVSSGVLVGLYMERSTDMLAALLGVMKSGGAYVPLDPIYPKHRIADILDDAQPKVLLTSTHLRASLPETSAHVLCLDELRTDVEADVLANLETRVTPDSLAYIIFTSGSTGRPKGVQIQHGALLNFLESMQREPGFTSDDVLLAVTTISFDIAGLELYLPLFTGGTVCIALEPGNVVSLMDDLERIRPTVMQATPATWQLLLSAGWRGDALLKILCGGEALETGLANSLLNHAESVWNMYGPTETTIWSSALRLTGRTEDAIPIGHPIANTTFYIVDAQYQPVPIGVAGELLIGGDGLARGYLNREELTRERFIDDPFSATPGARLYRTGDLVCYRRDGLIEFLGRLDHQIKLRGFRIELGEIESVLRQQPSIQDSVVLLREIGDDKHLVAWLVTNDTRQDTGAIRNALRQLLPEYMVPSRIVLLHEFPRTPNGKLDRGALAIPAQMDSDTKRRPAETLTPLQESIAKVFREMLDLQHLELTDNFFDLGAHSLLIVRVHERLRREIDSRLTLINFFQYPTIGSLADFLESHQASIKQIATVS